MVIKIYKLGIKRPIPFPIKITPKIALSKENIINLPDFIK